MQYRSVNDQLSVVIEILEKNEKLMYILDYLSKIRLPNFYVAAGYVFQNIWNYYADKPLDYGIKDIDIMYYDINNISKEHEYKLENEIVNHLKSVNINYTFDIHNEARMHLWKQEKENKDISQYKSSEDAITKWTATVHAVGVTKENEKIKIYAPYGLSDIFSRTIRPIKHSGNSKELYDRKVSNWTSRFDGLSVVDW